MQETQVWSLGWEDPLEEGMATHCNILAWGIPWTEEPGVLQSVGLQSCTRLSTCSVRCAMALCLKKIHLLLLFSPSVASDSLQHHGLQHPRLPCPSSSPGVCWNSCPLSRWCHLTISSCVIIYYIYMYIFCLFILRTPWIVWKGKKTSYIL